MFKTLKDIDIKDKRVLIRVDFNVPLDDHGHITDDNKIKKGIPTLQYLIDKGAKQIQILTHLGRPDGKIIDHLKTGRVGRRLNELTGWPVLKLNDCINVQIPAEEKIVIFENVRFHKAEKDDNENFAQALAEKADVYVNDAFGTCHRAHASVHAITKFLPCCAGLLLMKELDELSKILKNPEHPFVAVIGGAKLNTKIPVIENLLDKVDHIFLGGAMIFTFFKAKGFEIGKSLYDEAELETAKKVLEKAGDKLILPSDVIITDKIEEGAVSKAVGITEIPPNMIGVDIGPETISFFVQELKKAKTILWNGTLGVNEIEEFTHGSKAIAEEMASSSAETVVGGGDTVGFIIQLKLDENIDLVSTGGGATLEFLEGKELPALTVLKFEEEDIEDYNPQ